MKNFVLSYQMKAVRLSPKPYILCSLGSFLSIRTETNYLRDLIAGFWNLLMQGNLLRIDTKIEDMVDKNLNGTLSNEETPLQVMLERAIQGDERAFKKIYDLLSGKMYSLCVRYAGNTNDANDMFQEAFIRVYRSLGAYKGIGVFEGWVRKIFVNTCLDHLKSKQRLLYSELGTHEETRTSTDMSGIDRLSKDELIKIIQQLPNGYRLVVNLYLVEGYSHKEISEMLGIAEGTSKSQLSRARLLLQKEILEKNG